MKIAVRPIILGIVVFLLSPLPGDGQLIAQSQKKHSIGVIFDWMSSVKNGLNSTSTPKQFQLYYKQITLSYRTKVKPNTSLGIDLFINIDHLEHLYQPEADRFLEERIYVPLEFTFLFYKHGSPPSKNRYNSDKLFINDECRLELVKVWNRQKRIGIGFQWKAGLGVGAFQYIHARQRFSGTITFEGDELPPVGELLPIFGAIFDSDDAYVAEGTIKHSSSNDIAIQFKSILGAGLTKKLTNNFDVGLGVDLGFNIFTSNQLNSLMKFSYPAAKLTLNYNF